MARIIFGSITAFSIFAFVALWVLAIWTGDNRFGLTMIPVTIVAIVSGIVTSRIQFYREMSENAYSRVD